MEVYREHVLEHMHALWTNWRADLKRYNITKPGRSLRKALDHVPSGLDRWVGVACERDLFKGSPQGFIVTWFLFHCVLLSYFITNNHFYYKQISSYFVVISKIYKASARNSANRSYYKKDRLHRTGSKPYRQVAWELVMYLWNLRFFFFWAISCTWLLYLIANLVLEKGAKTGN